MQLDKLHRPVDERTHVLQHPELDTLFVGVDYPWTVQTSSSPFRCALDRLERRTWKQPQFPSINSHARTNVHPPLPLLAFIRAGGEFSSIWRYSRRNVCGARDCYRLPIVCGWSKDKQGESKPRGKFTSRGFYRIKWVLNCSIKLGILLVALGIQ